jgi:putative transposase
MPRRARVVVEGGVYHVYNRVPSGEAVLADPEEALRFIEVVRTAKERSGWTVLAWCVMSNHYHLVVRTSAVPVWRGMHHIQCTFSRGFNRRHGRTGSLWQSRYQARLVDQERYLSQVVLYVHLNPVRGGLVDDPGKYVFSGHREIVKNVKAPLIGVDDALLSFGDTARSARRAYLSAIREGIRESGGREGRPLDGLRSLRWRDRALERAAGQEHVDIQGRSSGLERADLSAESFVTEACRVLGVEAERLQSRARDSRTAELRRVVATLGVERWNQRGVELARVLGKNPDVVSWWVGQGVRRRLEDASFAERIDALDRRLAKRSTTDAAAHQEPEGGSSRTS